MKLKFCKKISLTLCAMVCLIALALALLLPATAQAYKTTDIENGNLNIQKIDEIFDSSVGDGGTFDRDNLQALVKALAGAFSGVSVSNDITSDVKTLRDKVDGNTISVGTTQYHNGYRVNNQNIIVEFGGIKWYVAFLSLADTQLGSTDNAKAYKESGAIGNIPTETDTEGQGSDLIVTLLQASPNTDAVKWVGNASSPYGTSNQNSDGTYPANMYGMSYLRSTALNAGSEYATSLSAKESGAQSEENIYAKFNMAQYKEGDETKKSNIHDYLVAPRFISWQYSQVIPSTWGWTEKGCALNNQAWGTMGRNKYYNNTYPYYEDDYHYDEWKDDLIWLPSCTEMGNKWNGNEQRGLWDLTPDQRSFNNGGSSEAVWLRTGSGSYYRAYGLTADGDYDLGATADARLVRPALHLNLTSAAQAANTVDKPTGVENNKTVEYNGQAQIFDLGIDSNLADQKIDIEIKKNGQTVVSGATVTNGTHKALSATEAAVYTVSLTPKTGYRWEGENSTNENPDTNPVTFTFTIKPRAVTLDVKGSTSYVYGESFSLSSAVANYWGYHADSNQFVNSDETKLTVSTPAAGASGAIGVGKYPLIVSYPDTDTNYSVSFVGDFDAASSANPTQYSDNNGQAATVEVAKRKVVLEVKGSATLTYGETFNMQGTTDYWSYASSSYTILDGDMHKLSVSVKDATSGTLLTPGSYGVQVTFADPNYDFSTTGSASITVNNAKIDLTQLEAFYANIASVEYRPNEAYVMSPDTALIIVKGNQEISVNLTSVSASLSGMMQNGKYVVSDAGTYTLTATISARYHDTEVRTFTVTISKATPVVSYDTDRTTLIYTSKTLPEITLISATIDGLAVEGTIRWTRSLGEVTGDSDNRFTWEFTPTDLKNYNVVTGDTTLNVRFVGVRAINVVFDPGDTVFYDTDNINDLKNYLTVVVDFNDDTSRTLAMNEYTLTCQGGDVLVVGDGVRVTISYLSGGSPVTRNFTVDVKKWVGQSDPEPGPGTDKPVDPNPGVGDTISKAKEFFENTPLPLGYATLVLGGLLLIIIILAIAGRKPKKKD